MFIDKNNIILTLNEEIIEKTTLCIIHSNLTIECINNIKGIFTNDEIINLYKNTINIFKTEDDFGKQSFFSFYINETLIIIDYINPLATNDCAIYVEIEKPSKHPNLYHQHLLTYSKYIKIS